jgi:phosphate transport system protein
MDHTLVPYDQELARLKDNLLKMSGLVEELISKSVEALKNKDGKLAEEVVQRDKEIDQLELEIDDQCISLIALYQPKAGDLRFITTAMKITNDLERMGDLAEDIAERTLELADQEPVKPLVDIPKMADLTKEILKMSLDAFVKGDVTKAEGVWEKEREIDKLKDQVYDELVSIMVRNAHLIPRAIPLLLVSRHLERIADHATNIAEDVVFMVEAKVVKHSGGENERSG